MARAGRRPGQTETREDILAAARGLFAERGYAAASMRAIAAAAGVNPALLHHFFGTKRELFLAAMNIPVDPERVLLSVADGPADELGDRLVRAFLAIWRDEQVRQRFLALIRSVVADEQTAAMMRGFITEIVLRPLGERLGVPPARLAAAVSQMFGIGITRFVVGLPPMADASEDEIAELVAPVLQYYLDGDGAPAPGS